MPMQDVLEYRIVYHGVVVRVKMRVDDPCFVRNERFDFLFDSISRMMSTKQWYAWAKNQMNLDKIGIGGFAGFEIVKITDLFFM